MRVSITQTNERNVRLLSATSDPFQNVMQVVNGLIAEAVKARAAAKKKPKADPVPARHS